MNQEILKSKYDYNPVTGEFKNIKTGNVVGAKAKGRNTYYKSIYINGKSYRAHRLAWLYIYGEWPSVVDHINMNGEDNRIDNLRSVSIIDNARNRRLNKNNKSGITGVSWQKSINRWVAKIDLPDKRIFIGSFSDFFEACCARKSKDVFYGFDCN